MALIVFVILGADNLEELAFSPEARSTLTFLMSLAFVAGPIITFPFALLGTTALVELGRRNELVRRPLVWVLTGAVMAGAPAFLAVGEESTFYLAFAFAGAVVARICRLGVEWHEQ